MELDERIDRLAELSGGISAGTTDTGARSQIRFPLRAAVSFTWFGEDGRQREAKGTSRNIGKGGAYIVSRCRPQVGAQINLVFRFLHMPAFSLCQRLEMSGHVVRVEALPAGKGFRGFAVASVWMALQHREDEDDFDAEARGPE